MGMVRTSSFSDLAVPLVVEPEGERSLDALVGWLRGEVDIVGQLLTRHGALLLRGFSVEDAKAFEKVAQAVEPELSRDYLGTSPRDALTDFVFTASELPGYYPIPQHCEMSFLPRPPRRVFFCCLRPNEGPGGETPLADCRKVYQDLDAEVRKRWEERGIRIVRNYGGPEGSGRRDMTQLKPWHEMFGTTDRAVIEKICSEHQFTPRWRDDGRLQLVSQQAATSRHPLTGEPVWFNHANVFHASAPEGEYRRIAGRMGNWPWSFWRLFAASLATWQRLTRDPEDAAMHVTFGDGGLIPAGDFEAVRDAMWKNMVFPRWQQGDVVVIDNASVAHGRMPYKGPRLVAVAWA